MKKKKLQEKPKTSSNFHHKRETFVYETFFGSRLCVKEKKMISLEMLLKIDMIKKIYDQFKTKNL